MKKAHPFFLIDPTFDPSDQERLAYAQDVFISQTFLGKHLIMCNGPIGVGDKCEFCQAPTLNIPHPYKDDILPFSSSFEVFPDLMKSILCSWPMQDLRLLGDIMRYECLDAAQDLIHVYQKRHPLGMIHMYQKLKWRILNVEPDFMRSLAQDVYFVPEQMSHTYSATLIIGSVVARLHLSPQLLLLGNEDIDEQWVVFATKHVPQILAEHSDWHLAWDIAWKAYMQEMRKREEEDSRDE